MAKIQNREEIYLLEIIGPRNKQFITSNSPPLYEKKNATKVYTLDSNQKNSDYEDIFAKKSKQKLSNITKYQLHQILIYQAYGAS